MTGKELKEALGVVAVVAGLLFVGWEIRQNNQLARAAAYQSMGAGLAEYWLDVGLAGHTDLQWLVMMETLTQEDIDDLPEADRRQLWIMWVSGLRTLEATWRQVELGLLDPEAFAYFGNDSPGLSGTGAHNLRMMWPDVKAMMSPDFAAFIEETWRISE